MALKFCPLFSGSSGNCTYIGTDYTNILIDAGGSGKQIVSALENIGVAPGNIDALIITHEHIDHSKGAGIISRKFDIPIYATDGTWYGMAIGEIPFSNKNIIFPGEHFVINDLVLTPFEIPHDAEEPVGIHIKESCFSAAVATDIGEATQEIKEFISDVDILLLEANYDMEMLINGRYTYPLKQRILSPKGHLSNEDAGKLLSEVISPSLKKLYLGHLSEENNSPNKAYEEVEKIVCELCGIDVKEKFMMEIAGRYNVSSFTRLE